MQNKLYRRWTICSTQSQRCCLRNSNICRGCLLVTSAASSAAFRRIEYIWTYHRHEIHKNLSRMALGFSQATYNAMESIRTYLPMIVATHIVIITDAYFFQIIRCSVCSIPSHCNFCGRCVKLCQIARSIGCLLKSFIM
jgi:hypothetical protein